MWRRQAASRFWSSRPRAPLGLAKEQLRVRAPDVASVELCRRFQPPLPAGAQRQSSDRLNQKSRRALPLKRCWESLAQSCGGWVVLADDTSSRTAPGGGELFELQAKRLRPEHPAFTFGTFGTFGARSFG